MYMNGESDRRDSVTTSVTVHRFRCIECGHTAYPTYHTHGGERHAIVKLGGNWQCQRCGMAVDACGGPQYRCERCRSGNTTFEEHELLPEERA